MTHTGETYRRPGIRYREATTAGLEPCGASRQEIAEFAESASRKLHVLEQPSLNEVVQRLGGAVRYEDFDWDKSTGSIYVHGQWAFDIVIPVAVPPTRERFTIAHEIGHYLIHARAGALPLIAPRLPVGKMGTRVEWEANWFASAFLMPADEFKAARKKHGKDLWALARTFRVSYQAARIRAATLGLV